MNAKMPKDGLGSVVLCARHRLRSASEIAETLR